MQAEEYFTPEQIAERNFPMACVALEITQICNLDITQERIGYESEMELNSIRLDYIKRAAGLPVRFFVSNAEDINLASFQMQADTGRGVLRNRDEDLITQQRMMDILSEGAGVDLPFDVPLIGHPDCNKYTALLKAGDKVAALYDDKICNFSLRLNEYILRKYRRILFLNI